MKDVSSLRRQQIESLLNQRNSQGAIAVKTLRKEEQYQVQFTPMAPTPLSPTPAQGTYTLHVFLPPKFPEVGPVLQLKTPFPFKNHPWVNAATGHITGFDKLLKWNMDAMLLGNIVVEVFRELSSSSGSGAANSATPVSAGTTPTQSTRNANNRMAATNTTNTTTNLPHPSQLASSGVGSQPSQPPQTQDFAEINNLSEEELTNLINDPLASLHFFDNLEVVKSTRTIVNDMRSQNETQAEKIITTNAAYQSAQESYKASLEKQMQLEERFQTLSKEYSDLITKFSPGFLLSKLEGLVKESEHQNEELTAKFLSNNLPLEDFLKQYRESRRLYHLRTAKYERCSKDSKILVAFK